MTVPPAPDRVPDQRPLAPSVMSVTSDANDKGDNEMISSHLLYSGGKSRKASTRIPSDEGAVRTVIASNGVPYLQMRSVRSHSASGKEKK